MGRVPVSQENVGTEAVRRSNENLVVQVAVGRHPIENLLVQFSVLGLVVMAILAVVLSVILTTRLNEEFDVLKAQASILEETTREPVGVLGRSELDSNLNLLTLTVYVSIGGGFIILYFGLISIVWRGWRTIRNQQKELLDANTDLRGANNELRDAQERLVRTERLAAIGELSAGVAHDLRSPLGAIKNAAYYTRNKLKGTELLKENPRIGEFLEIMDDEIESSNQILTDLMDFARTNPPNASPIEAEAVVDGTISRVQVKDNVQVRKDFEPGIPRVSADSEQLRRVFTNFIKNADEAMPDGGTITVSGKALNGTVELKFADTGEGIPEENLHRVLDPLFTTKTRGIGLGLAIVNTIVERHGGTVSVDSTVGEGTTFTVALPAADTEEEGGDGDQEA